LAGRIPLKNSICSQRAYMQDVPACNVEGFFGEINVFLQLSWIGRYGIKRAYVHLEILNCR
jgi:hypothetical protein